MGGPEILRVDAVEALVPTLTRANVELGCPVLVLVGGASGMGAEVLPALTELFAKELVPLLDRLGVAVVDGGTDAGVMRLVGESRSEAGATFPLIGVAAEGTVAIEGRESVNGSATVEPGHTHLILVPGDDWGDESPWLAAVGTALAAGHRSVTLLVNGGSIAYDDAECSLAAGRTLLVLDGSGRTADDIARAKRGETVGESASNIAKSPFTQVVSLSEPQTVITALGDALAA